MSNIEHGLGVVRLVVKHKVPSLNRLFNMNPWQRRKEKIATQAAMLSALGASDADCSTLTILHRNILSTAYATLACFLTTGQTLSNLQSRKRKSAPKSKSTH